MSITSSSAAVAGATALRDGQSYTKAADDVSSFNGFTNSQNNMTVTVSEPTLPAPYPSDVTYVEVDIAQNVPTYFLRVLGYNSMKVAARAVSGAVAGPACIYVGTGTFSNLGHTQAFEAVNVIRRRCANFHLGPEGTKDDAPGSKGAATVSAPGLG